MIGIKERRQKQAAEIAPGDEIAFYVTGALGFGAIARVVSEMFEDREPIWPQNPRKAPEAYPWRVEAEPLAVLAEEDFVPAEELAGRLDHVRKWPAEHWHLAFQGQLRPVSGSDGELLRSRIAAAVPL